ncbi:MAG: hypothetical protein HFI08_06435 [Bacilli bacterium]|nr:hypothetical protein [Bacilli bacterium]
MPEKCKLKYLKICNNEDLVYDVIDKWNLFLNQNTFVSKEEKLKKLEEVKSKDSNLYQAMKEDIDARLY